MRREGLQGARAGAPTYLRCGTAEGTRACMVFRALHRLPQDPSSGSLGSLGSGCSQWRCLSPKVGLPLSREAEYGPPVSTGGVIGAHLARMVVCTRVGA